MAPRAADKTYYVTLADRTGELGRHGFVSFDSALAFYRVNRPGVTAKMSARGWGCDADSGDGLSHDEHDQLR